MQSEKTPYYSRLAKHLGFDTEKTYSYIGSEINPFCELPDGGSYDPRKCGGESQQRFLWSNFGLCIAYNAIPLDEIYKVYLVNFKILLIDTICNKCFDFI